MHSYQRPLFMLGKKYLSSAERAFTLEDHLSLPVILMRRGLQLELNVKVSMGMKFHFCFYFHHKWFLICHYRFHKTNQQTKRCCKLIHIYTYIHSKVLMVVPTDVSSDLKQACLEIISSHLSAKT